MVYSLNTEFQLCNNEKVFMMEPAAAADVSMAEMDYKGAFSMGMSRAALLLLHRPFSADEAHASLCRPLQVRRCTGGCCGVPSRT